MEILRVLGPQIDRASPQKPGQIHQLTHRANSHWSNRPQIANAFAVNTNLTRQAYLLLTLTTLFWGGNSVAGKMASGEISPMLLTFARWAVAALIVFAFALPDIRRDWPVIRRNLGRLFLFGALGFTLFNVILYTALTKTSAVSSSIVQAAIPASVYALNFLIFRVKTTVWQIAGFIVTLAGVMAVAARGDISRLASLHLNEGDALVLVAVVIYSLYTVCLRFKPDISWKSLIAALSLSAAIASVPFVIWEWRSGGLILPGNTGWLIVLYTGIFPSILSQVFFIRGVELIGANRAGIFTNLIPIFGTGLAIFVLGEKLETFHIAALVLVVAGIWLAERKAG
jgi:drug/metabolite transporter (DMT)-like permease